MIGLPNSGTSSLLEGVLNRTTRINDPSGLDVYEAVLLRDSVSGKSELQDLTDIEEREDAMLLLSFAKFLVIKHYESLPSFERLIIDVEFQKAEVNDYFKKFCKKLFQFMNEVQSSNSLRVSLTRSHGFINFFDININKAAYEIVFILGGSYPSIVLFNMLNLYYYTQEKLNSPINLADSVFEGKYKGENLELFKLHTALEYYVHTIEATFRTKRTCGNAILVGTHADKFKRESDLNSSVKEISLLIDEYAQAIHIQGAIAYKEIIPLSNLADSSKYYEDLRERFYELVDRQKYFEEYVPMKFIFFRCMLRSGERDFIPYSELESLATELKFTKKEVVSFLDTFERCCSLFHLETASKSYIVLRPAAFIRGLTCVYTNKDDLSPANRDHMLNGYLPKKLAESFWGKPSEDPSNVYKFYTAVLTSVGLMTEIKSHLFFMPSIRSQYDTTVRSLNSLLTYYTISHLPFHKQCDLVHHFQKSEHRSCKLELRDCPFYNVVKFSCFYGGTNIAEVFVRFRCDFLEVSITPSCGTAEIPAEVYSYVKTTWVLFLNEVSVKFPGFNQNEAFSYKLAVICPRSPENSIHYAEFDPRETNTSALKCGECCKNRQEAEFDCSDHPARLWIQAACEKLRTITQPDDRLSIDNIGRVLKLLKLDSEPDKKFSDAEKIAVELKQAPVKKHQQGEYKSLQEIMFSILYSWRQSDPMASMSKLAKVFEKCNLTNIACHLNPSLHGEATKSPDGSSDFDKNELINIADTWNKTWQDLAKVLGTSTEGIEEDSSHLDKCVHILRKFLDLHSGDRRQILAEFFYQKGYYDMNKSILDL